MFYLPYGNLQRKICETILRLCDTYTHQYLVELWAYIHVYYF